MANVTAERNTPREGENLLPVLSSLPAAASTKFFKGAMIASSTAVATKGQAVKAGATTAQKVVGVALDTVDNTSGAAAALNVPVRSGMFKFANSASTDAIDLQHIGQACYAVDDQTLALTSNGGARPIAGIVLGVDADGVWVAIGLGMDAPASCGVIPFQVQLADLANATIATFTPQFAGKIAKISMSVMKAAAGAGGTCTITPDIGGTPLTGGVLTPTLATALAGAELNATAITALNAFKSGDAIHLVGSATTVFTAGDGTIFLHLG